MRKVMVLCCCAMMATWLQAQIIHVPADYPTIQLGINAANPGDTVLVADGTYYERINFLGKKPLMVASEFILDGDEKHITSTIIDGSQLQFMNNTSVVYFILGEDTTSVLCGFTITRGRGTLYYADETSIKAGGGIFIAGSGAKIIHNHIRDNHIGYNPLGNSHDVYNGAGIATERKMTNYWVVIEHNIIEMNGCTSSLLEASGGGIAIWCNARIAHNTIANNTCKGLNNSIAVGGGLICGTRPEWDNRVTAIVHHNVIANNLAQATNQRASYGGGLLQHVSGIVTDNYIMDNEVVSGMSSGGAGGFGLDIPLDCSLISGNKFSRNTCNYWGGALSINTSNETAGMYGVLIENNYWFNNQAEKGGALSVRNVPVCLQNNVFTGNTANLAGGAIMAWKDVALPVNYMIRMINNSFYDNNACYGGAIYSNKSYPLVVNSIFNNNTAVQGEDIFMHSNIDKAEIAFSNIDLGLVHGQVFNGGSNTSDDPLFADHKILTLLWESPCLDAGTDAYICSCGYLQSCPLYDINGLPRPENGGIDVGAHEILITDVLQYPIKTSSSWHQLYPNPVVNTARFEYRLDAPGFVQIVIYDITGRQVAVPVSGNQDSGTQVMDWNARNQPAGIYFYVLSVDEGRLVETGKLIIAK